MKIPSYDKLVLILYLTSLQMSHIICEDEDYYIFISLYAYGGSETGYTLDRLHRFEHWN